MGKFENDIEQKLGGFSLTPSNHVWEGVEAALQEKKKKRFAMWWWVPVACILLLGAGWWMMDGGREKKHFRYLMVDGEKKNEQEQKDATVTTEKDKQPITSNSSTVKEQELTTTKTNTTDLSTGTIAKPIEQLNNIALQPKAGLVGRKSKPFARATASKNKAAVKYQQAIMPTADNYTPATIADEKPAKQQIDITKGKEQSGTNQMQVTASQTVQAKEDSVASKVKQTIIGNVKDIQKKDSSSIAAMVDSIKKKKKKNKQPHQWLVTMGGGVSLVRGNNLVSSLNGNNGLFSNSGVGNVSPGTVTQGSWPSLPLPNTGFFGLVGVAYEGTISKHWTGNIGLQYRYIKQKQLNDSLTNHSHWLDLPANIKYTINPNSETKYGFLIGGSMALAFSQKWAYVPPTGNYYYDKALENRIILGLSAGAFIKTKNGLLFTMMGEQSLTPIHKASNNKYYWRQWSAQLSLPLNQLLHKPKN